MHAIRAYAARTFVNRQAAASAAGQTPVKGGRALGAVSKGLSVVGALMEFGAARQQAAAMDQQARDEDLARGSEEAQGLERVTEIDRAYSLLVARQVDAAGAMGIESDSGSITAAREAAQSDADRERRIIQTNVQASAAQRRLRAITLRQQAKGQRFGSWIKLGTDVVGAFLPGGG